MRFVVAWLACVRVRDILGTRLPAILPCAHCPGFCIAAWVWAATALTIAVPMLAIGALLRKV